MRARLRHTPPLLALVVAAVVTSACFGRLSMGISHRVDPQTILPGSSVRQEVAIEGDGLLGGAAQQGLQQSFNLAGNPPWQERNNSDGSTFRYRIFRDLVMPPEGTYSGDAGNMTLSLGTQDRVLFRTYQFRMRLAPSATTANTGTANSDLERQMAQLLLGSIRMENALVLPGSVTSTNGTLSDDGRVVWMIRLDGSEQVFTAESLYIDWARTAVLGAGVALVAGLIVLRRRRTFQPVVSPSGMPARWASLEPSGSPPSLMLPLRTANAAPPSTIAAGRLIDANGRIYALDRPVLTLGRTGCDITFVDSSVAPIQARVELGQGKITLSDVAGNTKVNGRAVERHGTVLRAGDEITLGSRRLTVEV